MTLTRHPKAISNAPGDLAEPGVQEISRIRVAMVLMSVMLASSLIPGCSQPLKHAERMPGDCAGDFYGKFHALQTFAGHPLRPHFLGHSHKPRPCCHCTFASISSATPTAMTSLESWMQQLPAEAKSRSICELALPGAHNAGASEVKCISPLVSGGGYLASVAKNSVANALAKPLAGVMAVCQADGIGQLLRKGVRLLDLRLGLHDEQLYICHTVVCNRTFCSVLEEVAEFLREQPEEVVVLLVKRDWGARDYFDTQEIWSKVQTTLDELLGPQLLENEDLPKPLTDLVKRNRRVLAMVELPQKVKQRCGIRITGGNLQSSWKDETRTVSDMLKDLECWYQSGRMRPQPGCLKVLEVCLPGTPSSLGPSACAAFSRFLTDGRAVHVATKLDFPDETTIRRIVEQNWCEPSVQGQGVKPDVQVARDVSHVYQKLQAQPCAGNCLDKLDNMTALLTSCTSTPFLGIVYGGKSGGNNWGYMATSCNNSKKSWISECCYCYLELMPSSSASRGLNRDAFRQGCEDSIRQSITAFPDGSKDCCIERASLIAKTMSEKAQMCCYAICKRCPGGFDQWAYKGPECGGHRFHEWRDTSSGIFGLGTVSHCFVVQLY
ncbi:unnamed protein product [Symbiodinium sp. KB8]|nr:unnamed protein product [Symbiodinium sp. KB8]